MGLVTLICIYLGTWETTKRYGTDAVNDFELAKHGRYSQDMPAFSPFPLLVVTGACDNESLNTEGEFMFFIRRRYLWVGKVILLRETKESLQEQKTHS
jgi:hypothetical protein